MGRHDRNTAPPPAGKFFRVAIYNPHNIALARSLARFLVSKLEADEGDLLQGRRLAVECLDELPLDTFGQPCDAVIVGLDEFTSREQVLIDVRIAFARDATLIAHVMSPNEQPLDEKTELGLANDGIAATFCGYRFHELLELIKSVADHRLSSTEKTIFVD